MRLRRVSNFLADSIQQIHSLRASGVISSQVSRAFGIKLQRLLQISRKIMNDAAGNGFLVSHHNSNGRGWVEKPTSLFGFFAGWIIRVDDAPHDAEGEPSPGKHGIWRVEARKGYGEEAKKAEQIRTRRRPLAGEFVSDPAAVIGEACFAGGIEQVSPFPRSQ